MFDQIYRDFQFVDGGREKLQTLGRAGWEKLLRSRPEGDYPDPFGDGTTYYEATSTGASLRSTAACHVDPESCPTGYLVWHWPDSAGLWSHEASPTYLLDHNAPRALET